MIRVELAIARAKESGKKVLKKEIAARLWPDSSPETQQVLMTKVVSGKQDKLSSEQLRIICEMTGCSADFLLGLTND